jgi:hypothetical protein
VTIGRVEDLDAAGSRSPRAWCWLPLAIGVTITVASAVRAVAPGYVLTGLELRPTERADCDQLLDGLHLLGDAR